MTTCLISGNNRGADALSTALNQKRINDLEWIETQMRQPDALLSGATTQLAPWSYFLNDIDLNRSANLAQKLDGAKDVHLIQADANSFTIPVSINLACACTDDPRMQAQIVRKSQADVTIAGLIVAAGGFADKNVQLRHAIGFGAFFTRDAPEPRQVAEALFDRLELLTGGQRTTSASVRDQVGALPQLQGVRSNLYRKLAEAGLASLSGDGKHGGGLFVTVPFPHPTAKPLLLKERPPAWTRTAMETEACRLDTAIAYVTNPQNPSQLGPEWDACWMHLVVPTAKGGVFIAEFPHSVAEEYDRRNPPKGFTRNSSPRREMGFASVGAGIALLLATD